MKKILLIMVMFMLCLSLAFGEEDLSLLGENAPYEVDESVYMELSTQYSEYADLMQYKGSMYIYKGYIYLLTFDKKDMLLKIDMATGKSEDLLSDKGKRHFKKKLVLADELIYIIEVEYKTQTKSTLYTMTLEGENFKQVPGVTGVDIFFNNGFYYMSSPTISRYSILTHDIKKVADYVVGCVSLDSGVLYLNGALHFVTHKDDKIIPGTYNSIHPINDETDDFFFIRDSKLYIKNADLLYEKSIGDMQNVVGVSNLSGLFSGHPSYHDEKVIIEGYSKPSYTLTVKENNIPYTYLSGLESNGNGYTFLTNNTLYHYEIYSGKLHRLNLSTYVDDIILEDKKITLVGANDQYIYYVDNDGSIIGIHKDGFEKEKLYVNIKDAELVGDNFIATSSSNYKPFILKKDGSTSSRRYANATVYRILSEELDQADFLTLFREGIYFYDDSASSFTLIDENNGPVSLDDGYISYTSDRQVLYLNTKTDAVRTLIADYGFRAGSAYGFIRKGYYYYLDSPSMIDNIDYDLYRINLRSRQKELVYKAKEFLSPTYSNKDYLFTKTSSGMLQIYNLTTGELLEKYLGNKTLLLALGDVEVYTTGSLRNYASYTYNTLTKKLEVNEGSMNDILVFDDIPQSNIMLNNSMRRLREAGIVSGVDNEAKLSQNITRAETATLVVKLLDSFLFDYGQHNLNPFDDVSANDWFAIYVNKVRALNLVGGVGQNRFDPMKNITDTQLAIILSKVVCMNNDFKLPIEYQDMYWEDLALKASRTFGIIDNSDTLNNKPITREEAFIMFDQVYQVLLEQHIQKKVNDNH